MKSAREFYNSHAEKQIENYTDEGLVEEFLEMRAEFAERSGQEILDAGCGHGRDTNFFSNEGLKSTGIDISDELIEFAQDNQSGEFKQGSITDLEFENDSFDSMWCSAVLHFLNPEDKEKAIEEFSRVIKSGGLLFLSGKTGNGVNSNKKWDDEVREWHISPDTVREKLEHADFQIEEVKLNKSENENNFISFICRKKPKESR